ncbi:MAG: hypothetical protein ACRD1X_05590 [Vicinamibacteria bacterium]
MKADRCPSCDIAVYVVKSDDGTHRIAPIGNLLIATRPCAVCGGPLCTDRHPAWPKEHYPPECDLWFGHKGLHRDMNLVPMREDFVWGEGDATWEHGRLVKTRMVEGTLRVFRGALIEHFDVLEPNGTIRSLSDFLPDGAWDGAVGKITITIIIEPTEND